MRLCGTPVLTTLWERERSLINNHSTKVNLCLWATTWTRPLLPVVLRHSNVVFGLSLKGGGGGLGGLPGNQMEVWIFPWAQALISSGHRHTHTHSHTTFLSEVWNCCGRSVRGYQTPSFYGHANACTQTDARARRNLVFNRRIKP